MFSAPLYAPHFVKAGGALFVGFGIVGADGLKNPAKAASPDNTLDPTLPEFVD